MKDSKKNNLILIELGKRIAYLRKKAFLSQLDLAYLCEISPSYLSDLELGKRNPSILVLSKIASNLKVSLEELLKGVGEKLG
ncbi:MAG: helix-turn-helix transcriptional regulator [Bacilli bacterium]|nr:helix-turn-helix transcriptional regulator [Bacilli bacterium]MDY6430302.1 helix-turn-helix transcriptional regulator [Bacilli bacterium]